MQKTDTYAIFPTGYQLLQRLESPAQTAPPLDRSVCIHNNVLGNERPPAPHIAEPSIRQPNQPRYDIVNHPMCRVLAQAEILASVPVSVCLPYSGRQRQPTILSHNSNPPNLLCDFLIASQKPHLSRNRVYSTIADLKIFFINFKTQVMSSGFLSCKCRCPATHKRVTN